MGRAKTWITRDGPCLGLEERAALALLGPVLEAYREPHRSYHNETHLGEVLDAVHALRSHCRDFQAVLLAAWFHDSVYRPERRDNEDESAHWAERALLAAAFPPAFVEHVARLVLSTKDHARAEDPDSRVLADADRRIWAAPPNRYNEYARGIRSEYGRYSWMSYAHGRRTFLAKVLRVLHGGPGARLFFYLSDGDETAARQNLEREARLLPVLKVLVARARGRNPLAGLDRVSAGEEPGPP